MSSRTIQPVKGGRGKSRPAPYVKTCSPFIRTFKGVSGGNAQNLADRTADLAPGGGLSIDSVTSFGEDARGELYITDYGGGGTSDGEIYRIIPGP